jgi:two-component system cell cycle sensor histidine kinase/response regulator CckA
MGDELRVLFIEDSAEDAELEERELRKAGYNIRSCRVETAKDILRALEEFDPTLIISDYSLPRLNGMDALKIVRPLRSDVPFIFVSGTIGEERAIESLKSGATDYVVKSRLGSLVSKVRRALAEVDERARSRLLEEQVRQAQKMEAIGRLAGGVAHDFNNLLAVINGYSELALTHLEDGHRVRPQVQEVLAAGQRAASLTRQLLAFSRKQTTQPVRLDLNAVVSNFQKMLCRLVGDEISLLLHLEPNLHRVLADAGQVEQVIMNLAVNARDAMPKGGRITISTMNVELEKGASPLPMASKGGAHVLLAVGDTGTGMGPEIRAHLFEPFFTTKESGKGTGLGLSTVHGIVTQAGGSIQVESEVGRGTTFNIYLPGSSTESTPVERPGAAGTPARGSETVLVTEDQENVRRLVSIILKESGYRVYEAGGGAEALKIGEDHQGPIHLLITDMVMRSMNGAELARLMKHTHPETKVLFMSGYADRSLQEEGLLDTHGGFLQKPFTVEVLRQKVREVLEG